MAITLLFILQYDMSQEPLQPTSQPYTGHVGSSPDFIHHPNQFLGQSPMVRVKCLDIYILNLATHQTPHSNTSLPHMVSSCISQVMVLVHHICLAPQP